MPPQRALKIFLPLEVDFPEDTKVRRLARYGRDARGCRDLLVQMWLYCKRTKSDGHVPLEEIGIMVYPDTAKAGVRDADRIVEVGLAERTDDGYYIPGFTKRNPTKAEIDAKSADVTAKESQSGRFGNHQKWHVNRGLVNSNCQFCRSGTDRGNPITTREEPEINASGIASGSYRSENRGQRTENISTSVALETVSSVTRANGRQPPKSTGDQRVADAMEVSRRLQAQGM